MEQITDIGRQHYVNPEDRETYKNILEAEGVAKGFETQLLNKDGNSIWVSITSRMVRNDAGEVLHYEGNMENITQRKEAEEALKQSETNMSNIINFLPDATFAINLEGKIILWNRAIEEMTGFPAHLMLGKGDYEYAIPFYGERRPILINFLFSWNEGIEKQYSFIHKEGDTLFTETDMPCVRGQVRTLWAKASPLRGDQGKIIGAIESVRDISDRRQTEEALKLSEQKYRSIFQNAVMGIFRTTPDGYYLSINPAGAKMYGYESEEEMIQSVTDMAHQIYVHPEDRKRLKELLEINGFVEGFESAHYTKDGSTIWVFMNLRVIHDNSGAILYYETTSQNITSRRQAEEALQTSETQYRSLFENAIEGVFQTTPE
ncbi:MAG: hypothetical protein C0399_12120, partial [Syntrophus sp. (in: bacteria)]|nr:hypothetical protein [Syntrophus sp. (in: bacteria)]